MDTLKMIALCVAFTVFSAGAIAFAYGEDFPKRGTISSVLCQIHPAHAEDGMCTPLQAIAGGNSLASLLAGSDSQNTYSKACELVTGDASKRECDRLEAMAAIEQEVRTIGCLTAGGKPDECNATMEVEVLATTCKRYDVPIQYCAVTDLEATMGSYQNELVEFAKRGEKSVGVSFAGPIPAVSALAIIVADRMRLWEPNAFRHLWPENMGATTTTAMKQ